MISITGLGPGRAPGLSLGAHDLLRSGRRVILRTERHPVVQDLRGWGVRFETCDDLYESGDSFDEVYDRIAGRVLEAAVGGDVVFGVPGHPSIGEAVVRLILERAAAALIDAELVGSASFMEDALGAAGGSLESALLIVDALSIETVPLPGDLPLLVFQVYDRAAAARVKLALIDARSPDLECVVVRSGGIRQAEQVERIPLQRLDRIDADHLTTVYVPPRTADAPRRELGDLVEVMRRLRAEDGCPWDREQTHRSLRKWLVEECYEAIDAIDQDDPDALCEELGDVLLQIVFHAQIGAETGAFGIDDVIGRIVAKLIRRHPHVFGDGVADTPEEVERRWDAIKKAEKADRRSALDGVPASLPALHRAQELGKRAAATGFDWERDADVVAKIREETREVEAAMASGDGDAVGREIGDLLFAVTNLARRLGVDSEEALRSMLARFTARFHRIEAAAAARGVTLSEMTLAEMNAVWDRAKREGTTFDVA